MIRDVGITVKYLKTVEVEEIGIKEEISYINHYLDQKRIELQTNLYNSSGSIIRTRNEIIEGDDYVKLVGDNAFAIEAEELWEYLDSIS